MFTPEQIIQKRKALWEVHHDIENDREYTNAVAKHIVTETPEGEAIRKAIQEKPELLIEMVFVIVNKHQQTVPFFLNAVQKSFARDLNCAISDYKQKKRFHLKFLIAKSRQQGFTSFITAYQLSKSIIGKNFTGTTIADVQDNTNTIFEDKAKYPYSQLPEILKPTEKFNNRKEFHFEKLNSKWRIATAGNENVGRSKTINFFHGSEAAYWDNMTKIITSLGPALTKDCIQILETTANGYNEYKELWDDAVDGNNNWEAKFYPWWLTPEYRQEFETDGIKYEFCDKVERAETDWYKKLRNLHIEKGLDWEQLYWYENQRREYKDNILQEYPCTPEESFLHSGRPYFDRNKVEEYLLITQKYKPIQTLQGGSILIYEEPQEGEMYVVGADIAEGLPEGDFSHAKFFKLSTWEEVIHIHGHFSTDRFGDLLTDYCTKYNNAYLGIERNNHGHAVLNTVYKYNKYKNIYLETVQEQKNDKPTKKLGWHTGEASKYLMLDEFDTAIRNNDIHPKDRELFREMREVVVDEKGKVSINSKDRVAATAIAWQMRKYVKKTSFFFG